MKEKIKLVLRRDTALTGVAQWTEGWPANQKATGSISSQGTCLGPKLWACERQQIDVSLPFFLLPFPSL